MAQRPKLLTMASEITASRKTLAAGRASERLWRARVRSRTAAGLLMLVGSVLLVGVLGRSGDVVIVVEQRHRGLHLGGRGIAHAVHVLAGQVRVGRQWLRLL